jgi:hypothetical protein
VIFSDLHSLLPDALSGGEYCRKSFIRSIQSAVIGCKDSPFAFPKRKASASTGAAGAFCCAAGCVLALRIAAITTRQSDEQTTGQTLIRKKPPVVPEERFV